MANTRDWDESEPTNLTEATLIDDYNRWLRVDVAERLSAMFYGFINGETSLENSVKALNLYTQSTPATPSATYGKFYVQTVSGNAEMMFLNEAGNEIQITNAGGLNYSAITITANSITAAMVRLANNTPLRGRNAADDGDINLIKVNASDEAEIPVVAQLLAASRLSSSAAPTADAMIASKKYVDDQLAAAVNEYDSGWFAVNSDSSYVKAHGLTAAPIHVAILLADDEEPTEWWNGTHADNGDSKKGYAAKSDATNVTLYTFGTYTMDTQKNFAFARIIASI